MTKLFYVIFALFFSAYLLYPAPEFPSPPPNSLVSTEPGDVRDPLIKAFYTNLDRETIADFYTQEFGPLPVLRLKDYPPEESPILIMDELKSSYLEEFAHPLRESIYVSVWEPTDPRYEINIDGVRWPNKVTVRYYPSPVWARFLVGCLTLAVIWVMLKFLPEALKIKK